MKKTLFLGAAATVAMIATVGTVSAHSNPEVREAIKSAITGNDYSAFQEAASDSRMIEKIDTQEKFEKLVEAKELKESGDIEGAKVIKEELGLKRGRGGKNAEARDAIDANDYAAFQAALVEGSRMAEAIDSEEKFDRLVEAHELKESGDREAAQTIKEELGLSHGDREGHSHRGDRESR